MRKAPRSTRFVGAAVAGAAVAGAAVVGVAVVGVAAAGATVGDGARLRVGGGYYRGGCWPLGSLGSRLGLLISTRHGSELSNDVNAPPVGAFIVWRWRRSEGRPRGPARLRLGSSRACAEVLSGLAVAIRMTFRALPIPLAGQRL